jgi:hypothetical protein
MIRTVWPRNGVGLMQHVVPQVADECNLGGGRHLGLAPVELVSDATSSRPHQVPRVVDQRGRPRDVIVEPLGDLRLESFADIGPSHILE